MIFLAKMLATGDEGGCLVHIYGPGVSSVFSGLGKFGCCTKYTKGK